MPPLKARIGYDLGTGSVRSVFVWTDGSPDPVDCGVGEALIEKWNTDAVAKLLTAGGDLTTLKVRLISRVPGNHPAREHSLESWPVGGDYHYLWSSGRWWYRAAGNGAWADL